jgi:hypothetical protein
MLFLPISRMFGTRHSTVEKARELRPPGAALCLVIESVNLFNLCWSGVAALAVG